MDDRQNGAALRYYGRVVAATGVGSLALGALTYVVQGETHLSDGVARGTSLALLWVDPFVRVTFLIVVGIAWAAAIVLAVPLLRDRRVWASAMTVLALGAAAVLVSGAIAPKWILPAAVISLPVGLGLCRLLPRLRRDVRAA